MLKDLRQLICWEASVDKAKGSEEPVKTAEQVKNEARENVIKDLKINPGESEVKAKDLVTKAKNEVNVLAGDSDVLIKGANDLLDKAEGEFKDIVALLNKRIEMKVQLESLKPNEPNFDFVEAQKLLNKIKADKDFLARTFVDGDPVLALVSSKEGVVDLAAVKYYKALSIPVDEVVNNDAIPYEERLTKLMSDVSLMQEANYNKFPGVGDQGKVVLKGEYENKISNALEYLQKNKDSLNPDGKNSLKRFEFANRNLAGAEKDKEPGHLSGAKDYMEMVLAEQDARRAMTLLGNDIGSLKDDFDKALKLSANEKIGDSAKARDLFREIVSKCNAITKEQVVAKNKLESDPVEKQRKDVVKFGKGVYSLYEALDPSKKAEFLRDVSKVYTQWPSTEQDLLKPILSATMQDSLNGEEDRLQKVKALLEDINKKKPSSTPVA